MLILNQSCLQSDLDLISSPWKWSGRGIKWSYFSVRHWHWLSLFVLFSSSWLTFSEMSIQHSCDLFSWLKRGFIYAKCKIKDQELYWSFASISWTFLKECYSNLYVVHKSIIISLTYHFFSHSNSLGIYWLKSLSTSSRFFSYIESSQSC